MAKPDLTDDDRVVAANVERLRKRAGMTQAELAHAMYSAGQTHWRQNTVSRVEHGRQKMGFEDLEAISGILGDVLAGTAAGERLRKSAWGFQRRILNQRLGRLEGVLQDALDGVQELRMVYDVDYREENPELRKMLLGEGVDDGQHPEED